MVLAVGMWIHVVVNAVVCFTPTRNPIWGELRLVGVIVSTLAVWMVLAAQV